MNQGESGASGAVDTSNAPVEIGAEPEIVETATETETAPEQQASEGSQEEQDGSEEGKKRRRGGFQKKIERISGENSRLAEENARLKAQLEGKTPEQSVNAPASKPTPEKFQSHDEWVEALTDWKAEQAAEKKLNEREERVRKQETLKSWDAKVEEARKVHPDYDEAIAEFNDVPVRQDIINAMADSDIGPKIAYYFTENPDELDAINHDGASALSIGKAIGRIESLLAGKTTGKAAVKTTSAPPPITPVKSASVSTASSHPRGYHEV